MSFHHDPEMSLLESEGSDSPDQTSSNHSFRTAPILTGDAMEILQDDLIPQRAVYGRILNQVIDGERQLAVIPKLYINSNAPFSAVVCGLQGSGKSHSTSVLLESCLIRDERLGTLPAPLSAVLFHFDSAAGGGQVQPCEAAYLATLDPARGRGAVPPEVTVLVLPNIVKTMRKVYAPLANVRVEPLHFSSRDISGERLLAMMKVDDGGQMPLYMELIMSILRDMEEFDYEGFRETLSEHKLSSQQKAMLNLRLALLDSCLKGGDENNSVSTHFKKGRLTIIDLSSPFMDASSACGFFDIILGIFLEAEVNTGRLIVLDEAHKYLTDTGSSSRLTDSLLTVIRQQRHLNTRVVVSTQEPTVVPPKFLELSSFIIAHRFSSPQWLHHLSAHVSAAQELQEDLFSQIVALQTGQAIVFAPSGLGVRSVTSSTSTFRNGTKSQFTTRTDELKPFGQGYLLIRSRQRITLDGGHSLLAVPKFEENARALLRITGTENVNTEANRNIYETIRDFVELADTTRIEEIRPQTPQSVDMRTCVDESASSSDSLERDGSSGNVNVSPVVVEEAQGKSTGPGVTPSDDHRAQAPIVVDPSVIPRVMSLEPRVCTEYYLLGKCPLPGVCKYGHNYLLNQEHIEYLRNVAKGLICSYVKKGVDCPRGEQCIYDHQGPNGPECTDRRDGTCRYQHLGHDHLVRHSQPSNSPGGFVSQSTLPTASASVTGLLAQNSGQPSLPLDGTQHKTVTTQVNDMPTLVAPGASNVGVKGSSSTINQSTSLSSQNFTDFTLLKRVLEEKSAAGKDSVYWTQLLDICRKRSGSRFGDPMDFRNYLSSAIHAGVIQYTQSSKDTMEWVQTKAPIPLEFVPLLQILQDEQSAGRKKPLYSHVAFMLKQRAPKAVQGRFGDYVQRAKDAGLVVFGCTSTPGQEWISLV